MAWAIQHVLVTSRCILPRPDDNMNREVVMLSTIF